MSNIHFARARQQVRQAEDVYTASSVTVFNEQQDLTIDDDDREQHSNLRPSSEVAPSNLTSPISSESSHHVQNNNINNSFFILFKCLRWRRLFPSADYDIIVPRRLNLSSTSSLPQLPQPSSAFIWLKKKRRRRRERSEAHMFHLPARRRTDENERLSSGTAEMVAESGISVDRNTTSAYDAEGLHTEEEEVVVVLHREAYRGVLILAVWCTLVWLAKLVFPWQWFVLLWLLWVAAVRVLGLLQLSGPGYCTVGNRGDAAVGNGSSVVRPIKVQLPYDHLHRQQPNQESREVVARTDSREQQQQHNDNNGESGETDNNNDNIDVSEGVVGLWCRSCARCNPSRLRPPRCGHCRICGSCVAQLDHHCIVFGCCVGRDNIRWFVCILGIATISLLLTLVASILSLKNENENMAPSTALSSSSSSTISSHASNVICLVLLTVAVFSLPVVGGGFGFYVYLYGWLGVTYREWRQRGEWMDGYELSTRWSEGIPRPFASESVVENLKSVLCGPPKAGTS